MKVLVLGGTRFLGPAVVSAALARGDEVTTFTRGVSGQPPPGVTALHGDRAEPAALDVLRGREFDLVVDTCGYVPSVVGEAARRLSDNAGHYAFVSTINVYPDWPDQPIGPDSRVHDCPPDAAGAPPELEGAASYGYLKAGCERAVESYFPKRSTQVRAGLLVGPQDNSGRLTWWIGRIARGGRVPVPGTAQAQLSFVDVRDLARWMLDSGTAGHVGAYNATGPADMTTYGEVFEACRAATGSDAELVWIPEEAITAAGIEPWTELPLWVPSSERYAFDVDVRPILDAGLRLRAVAETVADTWAWQRAAGPPPKGFDRKSGMTPEQEATLLGAG
jgi:nucleoside-diphosphate-sugar epimerase